MGRNHYQVERILREARSNGRVGIVTLAQRPWVLPDFYGPVTFYARFLLEGIKKCVHDAGTGMKSGNRDDESFRARSSGLVSCKFTLCSGSILPPSTFPT